MPGQVGVARESADAHALPLRQFFHGGERQTIDVNELLRRLDAHLHQVHEVCAAAEKFGARLRGEFGHGLRRFRRAEIGEWVHRAPAVLVFASRIAATMFV